jgi:predicted TIM-barrel fold metal-dependent hydrolase
MTPPFIDAHLHLWDLDHLSYPWMSDPALGSLRRNYLPADFRRDTEGLDVVGVVHVQAEVDHAEDPVSETAWLAGLAAEAGDEAPVPTVCVGYADLRDPALSEVLDRHAEHELFVGVRQEAWFDPNSTRADILTFNLLEDPDWERGLRLLSERGLSFDLLIFPNQLQLAAELFSRVPDLPVILGHTAVPDQKADPGLDEWRAGIKRFAEEVPRGIFKLSGMGFISGGEPWEASELAPIVREGIEIFGPDRCLFASNWPVERLAVERYAHIWEGYDEMTSDFSPTERSAMFVDTAARTYRIAQ